MKLGKFDSLQAFAAEIDRRAAAKRDLVADTRKCALVPVNGSGVELQVGDDQRFSINDVGHDQLAETVDIPRQYYHRMRQELPELLARNVNDWFQQNPQKRLFRTLTASCGRCAPIASGLTWNTKTWPAPCCPS